MSWEIKYEYSVEVQQVLDLLEGRKGELEDLEYFQFGAHVSLFQGSKEFHFSRERELQKIVSQLAELKAIFKPIKVFVQGTSVESVVKDYTLIVVN